MKSGDFDFYCEVTHLDMMTPRLTPKIENGEVVLPPRFERVLPILMQIMMGRKTKIYPHEYYAFNALAHLTGFY